MCSLVTGVQTCALPICRRPPGRSSGDQAIPLRKPCLVQVGHDVALHARDVFLFFTHRSNVVQCALRRLEAFQSGDYPACEILRRKTTARGGDVSPGKKGCVSTSTPASRTHGFVVSSVYCRNGARLTGDHTRVV